MQTRVDPSLSLLRPEPSTARDVVDRARVLLETRPGMLPWSPTFGCDLDRLTRGAATTSQIALIRSHIESVLAQGLPAGVLGSTEVRIVDVAPGTSGGAPVPFAERALASTGARATVEVRVVLRTQDGPVTLHAKLPT